MTKTDYDIIEALKKKPMTIGQLMKQFKFTRKQIDDKLKRYRNEGYDVEKVGTIDHGQYKNVALYGFVRKKISFHPSKRAVVKLPEQPMKWFDCLPV